MGLRRALVPYHFGHRWDIIPNREGVWDVILEDVLSDRLLKARETGAALVVSGDCMAAIPAQPDNTPLVWMDAHGDFHTLLTTLTGSIGGMPLAMLRGLGDQRLLEVSQTQPVRKILHLGGSEFDKGERETMLSAGVDVEERLPVSWFSESIHLHIDTDVIRSSDFPSSIHPAPNGMSLSTFWETVERLLPCTRILSIKTYDPRLDAGREGETVVLELIRRFERCWKN